MSDTEALVYVDLAGTPALVGRLWSRARKGRESASFEYDKAWLEHPERFALEPALTLGPGPQHAEAGKALFGARRFRAGVGRRRSQAGRAAFRAAAGRTLSRARGAHSAGGQPAAAARGIRARR